jgi:prepilin-type N-terminal cleavage/methylation domain-containing protein/prepilin-type processing-associated H-X9-DG protein
MVNRRGMTLVELIVVMAVVGMLAGVLVSAVGRGTSQAREVKCISNLRNIGSAMMAYAQDNEMCLPELTDANGVDWDENLKLMMSGDKDKLKDLFYCAGQKKKVRYGYNALIGALNKEDGTPNAYRRLANIVNASTKVMVGCVERGKSIGPNVAEGGYNKLALVHDGRAVLLFADGHVVPAKDSEVSSYSKNFDPSR